MSGSQLQRDPIKQVAALSIANAGIFAGPYTTPLIIGALIVGFGVNEAQAGSLITAELLVMGLVALMAAPLLARLSRRPFAICGALLLLMGTVGAALSNAFEVLYGWRVLSGCGAGLLLAAVNAVIASARSPARIYGLATLAACAITGTLTVVMPHTLEALGPNGYYAVLAVLLCVVSALVVLIPNHMGDEVQNQLSGISRGSAAEGWTLMLGIFIIGIAMMVYYAFIERLGVRLDLALESIGLILTGMMIASAVGAGMAALVGQRFGIVTPLLLVTALHALVIVVAVYTTQPWLYACAVISQGLFYMFMFPFLLALAAKLDVEGRWAAAASGASFLSFGTGPLAGGWLITQLGYEAIAWSMVMATIPGMLMFLWVGRRIEKAVYSEHSVAVISDGVQ